MNNIFRDSSGAGAGLRRPPRRRAIGWVAACGLCLAGCTAGPDFVRPAAPDMDRYDAVEPAAATSAPRIEPGQALPAQWWALFQSPALAQLLDRAIAANQTLAGARATLAQAQESIVQARAGWYPSLDLGASAGRSSAGRGTAANAFSLGPSVSYNFDLAGQVRRSVEQAQALAENQRYQLAAAYLTLTGDAVSQAITIAVTRKLLAAAADVIRNDEKNLDLVRKSLQAGTAAKADLLTAQAQLENDRTQLPALGQQLSVAQHALAILAGQAPAQAQLPDFDLDAFAVPEAIPLSLPSALVRQRPDILSAEAVLHADSAAIGIAAAQLYPTLTLSASASWQSSALDTLLNASGRILSAGAGANWSVFQGGALEAQRRAAADAYDAQLAAYRQTVLQAFGQVADALRAIENDRESQRLSRNALAVSAASLHLQQVSYRAGKSTVLQLIAAENAYSQAVMNDVRIQGQRLQNCVQLFTALGGGWRQAGGEIGLPADETGRAAMIAQ